MSTIMEINPFDFFTDTNGDALDAGFIYIGQPNLDPRQYPATVFYDAAATIPAAMPLRTSNGYIVRNGSPTFLYVNGNYSVRVEDSRHRQVYYVPDFLLSGSGGAVNAGDLANQTDPTKGAALVGFIQRGASAVGRTALDKMRESVSVEDFGAFSDTGSDLTTQIQNAINSLGTRGGFVQFLKGTYLASRIVIPRNVILVGQGATVTTLLQTPGANQDFVLSENFSTLTGSGLSVSASALVPSWFGAYNLCVSGNRPSNTSGRGMCLYGAFIILVGVVVMSSGGDGLYTEYATNVSSLNLLSDQEEGYIKDLVTRDNNGTGWLNRGPHNVYMDNITTCRNESWGYVSEIIDGTYNGAPTYCTMIHGYLNDFSWTFASGLRRKNLYFGTNGSYGQIVVDGGCCEIASSNNIISNLNQYFGGQGGDSVLMSGNRNVVGVWSGRARGFDSTSTDGIFLANLTGDFNSVAVMQLYDNNIAANAFANGLQIIGTGNAIADAFIRGTKTGLRMTSSRNRVTGWIQNTVDAGLAYAQPVDVHNGRNRLKLDISPVSGSYVVGDPPLADFDQFEITGNGLPGAVKRTEIFLETSTIAGDVSTTGIKTLVVTHNLLYTPRRRDISINYAGTTNVNIWIGWLRVSAFDDTTFTIQYLVQTAGTGSDTVAFTSKIKIS